jgi:hypothetical protein
MHVTIFSNPHIITNVKYLLKWCNIKHKSIHHVRINVGGPHRKNRNMYLIFQQFENTVVLLQPYTHLISTSIGSHNGDNVTKDLKKNIFTTCRFNARNYLQNKNYLCDLTYSRTLHYVSCLPNLNVNEC